MNTHEISPQTLPLKGLQKTPGHKFTHGHALVLSGGAGRTGAARLAARGALRIGAGLVTLGVPPDALLEVASQVTAIMVREIRDIAGLKETLRDDRINALCIGPGLGLEPAGAGLIAAALETGRKMVLDADALSLIAQDRTLFDALHRECVITPHGGEFARLFPDISERLKNDPGVDKVLAASEAASRAGCFVLLKGALTVVAEPDGPAGVHRAEGARSSPWLATAGAGDVLAGYITGLMARGFAPGSASELATYLHVESALSFGPGLIAEDLPEQLPKILQTIGS
ncbi:MAG: NAD(P)H-hydrate dehydratase [Pseudomonadota bacterium]